MRRPTLDVPEIVEIGIAKKKVKKEKGCAPHNYKLFNGIWVCWCGVILPEKKKFA